MNKWILCFVVLLCSTYLFADVPNEITYNGRLREYGQPITATRTMNFKIYDDASAGASPWGSGNVTVAVSSGVFSYILSPQNVDWKKKDYWLETTVEGKVLSPREKLTSHIYALHAQEAENINSDSKVSFSINNTEYMSIETNGEAKNITNGTTYYMVPRGAIIMWSGISIPTGWAICDGSNGTPDLRDRFIMGTSAVNNTDVNQTGGANSYTLSVTQLPIHTHSFITQSSGSHTHDIYGGPNGYPIVNAGSPGNTATGNNPGLSGDSQPKWQATSAGAHTHSGTTDSIGNGNPITIIPKFYKLAFIMKI